MVVVVMDSQVMDILMVPVAVTQVFSQHHQLRKLMPC